MGPLPSPFWCGQFFIRTFKPAFTAFHYQWGSFAPWWGPFTPVSSPGRRVRSGSCAGSGSSCPPNWIKPKEDLTIPRLAGSHNVSVYQNNLNTIRAMHGWVIDNQRIPISLRFSGTSNGAWISEVCGPHWEGHNTTVFRKFVVEKPADATLGTIRTVTLSSLSDVYADRHRLVVQRIVGYAIKQENYRRSGSNWWRQRWCNDRHWHRAWADIDVRAPLSVSLVRFSSGQQPPFLSSASSGIPYGCAE